MKASEFCNREVVVIERDASVQEAAKLMREHHVGSIIVVGTNEMSHRPIGVLTDRDIVIEFIAKELSPTDIAVGDAMSFELVTVSEDCELFEVVETMKRHGVRRIPVVDTEGSLVGLVASDDALDLLVEQLSDLVAVVEHQWREEAVRRD